jgi:hypothetical protein
MTNPYDNAPSPPQVPKLVTDCCFVCGGNHPFKECPTIQPPAPPGIELPKETPSSVSLAPTQFEELFGEGAEGLLQDVLERPDVFTKDQRDLALSILGGDKTLRPSDGDDRELLDNIAYGLAVLKPPMSSSPAGDSRPSYVRTREEMEDF